MIDENEPKMKKSQHGDARKDAAQTKKAFLRAYDNNDNDRASSSSSPTKNFARSRSSSLGCAADDFQERNDSSPIS